MSYNINNMGHLFAKFEKEGYKPNNELAQTVLDNHKKEQNTMDKSTKTLNRMGLNRVTKNTIYIKAVHIKPEVKNYLRNNPGYSLLVLGGAKLYSQTIGCVVHYYISGYHYAGDDVQRYAHFALSTDPNFVPAEYDTDGDFLPVSYGYKTPKHLDKKHNWTC